jgi:dipeptidyl aminopeptidase/acylaminoacyl peptidase
MEYPSARPLDLPPDTHLLSVSPSGELALLINAHVVTGSIMVGTLARAPLGAGVPRGLLDNVRDADWVGSGQELAIVREAGDKDRLEFPPGRVLYQSDGYLSELRAAPDGTRFAAFEHRMKWEAPAALVVIDLQGRKSVLSEEYPFTRGLAWEPAGKEILFGASSGGAGNTAILAATLDGKVRLMVEGAGSLTVHDASGANEWLVSRDDLRVGVRALAPGETAERELSWLDRSAAAGLSGDGRSLLFTELAPPAGAAGSVCVRGTNGAPVLVLGAGMAQDVSRDGSLALAIIHQPPQLLLYPTGVGEKRTLPRGGIQQYRWASWFADGRRVAVCGTEQGRASRCYVQALDGTPPQPVTPEGDWALASPDGRRLLVWKPGAAPLIYGVDGGPAERIASATAEDAPAGWTPDGRGVFVHRPQQVPGEIDRIDLGSGRRERAWQFSPPDHVGLLSFDPVLVAADGSAYTYSYTRILSTLFKVEFGK